MKKEDLEKMEDLLDAVWVSSGFHLNLSEDKRIEVLKEDLDYLKGTIEFGYDYEEVPEDCEAEYEMHWAWILANYYFKCLYFLKPSELVKIYRLPKKRIKKLRETGGMKLVRKVILEELSKIDCRNDFVYSANKCKIMKNKALWKRIITYFEDGCNLDYYIF